MCFLSAHNANLVMPFSPNPYARTFPLPAALATKLQHGSLKTFTNRRMFMETKESLTPTIIHVKGSELPPALAERAGVAPDQTVWVTVSTENPSPK